MGSGKNLVVIDEGVFIIIEFIYIVEGYLLGLCVFGSCCFFYNFFGLMGEVRFVVIIFWKD